MKLETGNQKHNGRRREKFMLYAPLLIWIGVIFFLSSSQGSMTRTSLIIRPILEFLFPTASEETLLIYHGYIRKLAHFSEYAVLGLLACRAFIRSRANFPANARYLVAAALVTLVALIDEFTQSFNPARTGSLFDVVIDISGGLFAIVLFYLLMRRWADGV